MLDQIVLISLSILLLSILLLAAYSWIAERIKYHGKPDWEVTTTAHVIDSKTVDVIAERGDMEVIMQKLSNLEVRSYDHVSRNHWKINLVEDAAEPVAEYIKKL